MVAGRSVVSSRSKTVPDGSSTIRTQTDPAFGAAATISVTTASVASAKVELALISVGAPDPSLWTICQRVCVPRWKPMPTQFTTALSVSVVASAAVEP